MSRKRLICLAALMAIAVMVAPMQPASANGGGVAVFAGNASLSGPICYPTLCPAFKGVTRGFTFTSLACVGASVSAKKTQVSGPTCAVNANGTLGPGLLGNGPWCGHSAGSFGGSLTYTTVAPKTYTFNAGWISAGSVLVITGTISKGAQSGPFASVVVAVPNPLAGSCTTGATQFLAAGAAAGVGIGSK